MVRLDIGVQIGCKACMELAKNALLLEMSWPGLEVHFLPMDRFGSKRTRIRCGKTCLPMLLVNGSHPFYGTRSIRQLILLIAEAAGKDADQDMGKGESL